MRSDESEIFTYEKVLAAQYELCPIDSERTRAELRAATSGGCGMHKCMSQVI